MGDKKKEEKKKVELAPFRRLFFNLNRCDKSMYAIAVVFSMISGSAMSVFAILFSGMIDSFDPDNSLDDLLSKLTIDFK